MKKIRKLDPSRATLGKVYYDVVSKSFMYPAKTKLGFSIWLGWRWWDIKKKERINAEKIIAIADKRDRDSFVYDQELF